MATATVQQQKTTNPTAIIATLAAAGIVVSMAQTLVIPIIGSLPDLLHTSASNASWVVTITLLTGAISTPVMGRLADMHGKKKMILIALIPFIVGSVICALSGSLVPMVIGRGLQGLATGVVPLGISLLHDVLPSERVGSAMALMSSSLGVGGALGLPASAAIIQFADWRVLFWITAAAGVLILLAVAKVIPSHAARGHEHGFDWVGTVGLGLGLTGLLLGISKGTAWGWTSPLTLGMLLGAVVVFVLWSLWELRRPGPLVDLHATVRPVVLLTNIASILIGFSMYAQSLILPQLMQLPVATGYGHGQSTFQMGLWMAPAGLGMMAVSGLGAAITRRWGAKVTLTIGSVVMAIGYLASALGTGSLWVLVFTALLTSCGTGLTYGAMPALILSAVPATEKAAANGFNSLMRSLGTTIAAAVIGLVLSGMSVAGAEGHSVPTLAGFTTSLLIGGGLALIAAIAAALIPGPPVRTGGKH